MVALLSFLAGLLSALRFAPPVAPAALSFFIVLIAGIARVLSGRIHPFALFFASGLTIGAATGFEVSTDCRTAFSDGDSLVFVGRLGAAHRPPGAGGRSPLLPLIGGSVFGLPGCGGELRVRLPPETPTLPLGAEIRVIGHWRTFDPPVTPSHWPRDPRFTGFLLADSVVITAASGGGVLLGARARADAALERLFPDKLEMFEALLLGRREYVDTAVRDRYTKSGLAHLLAISGMHVGLLAGVCLLVASSLRLPRRRAILLTLFATWVYLLVIGAAPSAIRAGIMISLSLSAVLLQRPSAAAPIMAAAAFAILARNPLAILDPGFQLSFAGVLGILLFRAPLLTLTPDHLQSRSALRSTIEAFMVGVAASITTAPIVAHHFGVIAPISLIAGVLAVPLMSLALISALAALVLEPLVAPIAYLLADGGAAALSVLDRLAAIAAAVPFGNGVVAKPPWWSWIVAATIGLYTSSIRFGEGRRLRWIVGVGAAFATLTFWPLLLRSGADGIQIHFIDVGQGDAIAIRTPRNRWILVDTGPASDMYDAGERRVLPFLKAHGARHIEALVLTHPDLDHIGGARAILRGMHVAHIFEPGMIVGRSPYLGLLDEIDPERTEWRAARAGRTLELDDVHLEFLWPDPEAVDATEDANQISAVVRIVFGAFSLLLTGDAGIEVEERLVDRHQNGLAADVLKLGHHGSATSTSDRLLETVQPSLAIVSAGRRNRYGHPAPVVMQRVERHGIPIARTDQDGTISLLVEPDGLDWRREEW